MHLEPDAHAHVRISVLAGVYWRSFVVYMYEKS